MSASMRDNGGISKELNLVFVSAFWFFMKKKSEAEISQ